MPRNFGLSHVIPRGSSRAKLPGLAARLLYSVERALEGVHHGFSKRDSLPRNGIPVRIVAEYMGRVIFHVGETRTYAYEKSSQREGKSCVL